MTSRAAPYASPIDGDPPAGAEVHAIPHRHGRSAKYRTIKVARQDGTIWYCRAVLLDPSTPTGGIVKLPDHRHFYACGHLVDRDDPSTIRWLMAAVGVAWSGSRDQAFLLGNDVIAAFGVGGRLWDIRLPGADPDGFISVDFVSDGVLRCTARQREPAANGEPVFMTYAIDVADGSIRQQWSDELLPEEAS